MGQLLKTDIKLHYISILCGLALNNIYQSFLLLSYSVILTTGAISVILALHHAVKHRDKSSVETFLDGLTPEQQLKFLITQDTDGNTALHYAVRWGCTETVQSLLDNLTPDQQLQLLFTQDSDGETALHYAARGKHTEKLKTLLDNLTPEQKLQLLYVKKSEGYDSF